MTRTALETAIIAAMEVAAVEPMQWGKDDCALWAANILRPVLGYDPAAAWRGRYRTRSGAYRVLGKSNLANAIRAVARRHHWKRIYPTLAQAGDVGMVWTEWEGKPVLATVVCRARGWFVGRAEAGFTAMPAERVAVAWSVLPDALAASAPRASLPSLRREMVPTSAARHEPISTFIGLSALINGVLGIAATSAVGGLIGGAIVGVSLSKGVSFCDRA